MKMVKLNSILPSTSQQLIIAKRRLSRSQFNAQLVRNVTETAAFPNRMLSQPTHFTHPNLIKENELNPGIPRSEFADRRQNFAQLLQETVSKHGQIFSSKSPILALIPAPQWQYMAPDVPYEFRQSSHFQYLTGILEPGSMLAMWSSGDQKIKSTLFVAERNEHHEVWNGPMLGVDDANIITGIDEVIPHAQIEMFMRRFRESTATFINAPSFQGHPHSQQALMSNNNLKFIESPYILIDELRLIKSMNELNMMRKACQIGAAALNATMQRASMRNPASERDLVGIFTCEGILRGAERNSYPPVVAAGNQGNIIHYMRCDMPIRDDELILMDAGIDFHGYVSDITRTWPLRAEMTGPQKALYLAILEVHNSCLNFAANNRPLRLDQLMSHCIEQLLRNLIHLGAIDSDQAPEQIQRVVERAMPHHVSHYLGMDVHDCATVKRNIELPANTVITIEPGVYFPANDESIPKHFRGMAIRIEDDIIIKEKGIENLTRYAPTHPDELKAVIQATD